MLVYEYGNSHIWRAQPGDWIIGLGDLTMELRRGNVKIIQYPLPAGRVYKIGASVIPFEVPAIDSHTDE